MDIYYATWLAYFNEAIATLEMCMDTAADYADKMISHLEFLNEA